MNFNANYKIKVYYKENGYFTRIVKFNKTTNEWESAFIYLHFKKGVDIPNRTTINVKESWLSFYTSKKTNKVVVYIFINDFNILDNNNDTKDIEIKDNQEQQ